MKSALAGQIDSGYNIARMRYDIIFAPEAVEDLHNLKANTRAIVRDAIEQFLRYQPTKTSKARTKRLRGLSRPQYRLRVEDIRIFYDVVGGQVEVLAIVPKSEVENWLKQAGESNEEDRII